MVDMTNEEMEKAIEKGEMTTELAIQLLGETGLDCMYEEETQEALDMAIKALESQRWIPVSERLPENQDCYLVTTKWKGSYSGDVYIETNMAVYREKPKEWDCVDVIAWMPLPQPYKGESEDAE